MSPRFRPARVSMRCAGRSSSKRHDRQRPLSLAGPFPAAAQSDLRQNSGSQTRRGIRNTPRPTVATRTALAPLGRKVVEDLIDKVFFRFDDDAQRVLSQICLIVAACSASHREASTPGTVAGPSAATLNRSSAAFWSCASSALAGRTMSSVSNAVAIITAMRSIIRRSTECQRRMHVSTGYHRRRQLQPRIEQRMKHGSSLYEANRPCDRGGTPDSTGDP